MSHGHENCPQCDEDSNEIDDLKEGIERLERELAEAKKDTERLDWILDHRASVGDDGSEVAGPPWSCWFPSDDGPQCFCGETAREAIDAAREEGAK